MPPSATSQPGYFRVYIDQVTEPDLLTAFNRQNDVINHLLSGISEEQSTFSYAQGKWTLKEMLQHIIDAERVFGYRAMCFARKEKVALPSFDENEYAASSGANGRSWESLTTEFRAARKSLQLLFESFTPEMLACTGIASNNTLSVRDIGLIAVGHFTHHCRIIEERYLGR